VITEPSLPSHVAREHAEAVWKKGRLARIRVNSTAVVVLKVRVFMVCVAVLLDWGHARKRRDFMAAALSAEAVWKRSTFD
jgi:hypothetical protein